VEGPARLNNLEQTISTKLNYIIIIIISIIIIIIITTTKLILLFEIMFNTVTIVSL